MKKACIFLLLIVFLCFAGLGYARPTTKVYKDKGGDRQVVASGGEILIESSGDITVESGGTITVESGGTLDIETGATFTYDDLINSQPTFVQNTRTRVIIADVNTGVDLLPAIAGKSYRVISCSAEAYGGAVGSATSVDISGDDGSAAILFLFAQSDLVENAMLLDADATTLAAGASYVANTAGVAISVKTVGTAADTATGIDFILSYVIE